MSLASLLESHKNDVLSAWEAIVGSLAGARQLSGPALRNYMPGFYDWLVKRVREAGRGSDFPHEQAIQHANERVAAGYDLSEVISEYAVLRDCVFEAWEHSGDRSVTPGEIRVFSQALDEAIAFTAVFYARRRLFREDPHDRENELVAPH